MRKIIAIVVVALFGAFLPAVSQAISLSFSPTAQTKNLGNFVSVNVVVSGLNGAAAAPQIVSAYDLDVTYDSSILGNAWVDYSPLEGVLGTSFDTLFYFDTLTPGRIDFSAVSTVFDAELNALQGDSVVLATLNFTAIGLGTSALFFDPVSFPGIDVKGLNANKILFDTIGDGSVTVIDDGVPSVPEPGTMLLLGVGLAGLAIYTKRRKINKE
jgi:hypothetical protein